MKIKLLSIVFVFFALTFSSNAQSIFTNAITDLDSSLSNPYTNGQIINANITVSGIGRGSGITAITATNRYTAANWSTTVLDVNDYFEFTLTPNFGYKIDLTSFVYTGQVSSGTPSYAFRSSVDGFSTNIGAPVTAGTTISLAAAAYQNLTGAITFRYYAFGLAAGTTTYSINDFTFNGTVTSTGPFTVASGDWNVGTTWSTGTVPLTTDNVTILAAHTVYTTTTIVRTGTTIVNGGFELRNGGYASGTNFAYNAFTGTLNFNTTGGYSVANTDVYWPTGVAKPYNVNVLQGGITLATDAPRIVDGLFTTANGGVFGVVITSPATLTLNGTCRINTGGFFQTGTSPIFGAASTLQYNSGGVFGRGLEWSALGVGTIGVTQGYPNNVQLSNNTTLNYTNGTPMAKAMNGNLTVDAGSSFFMDYGSVTSGGFLTVAGNVSVAGSLSLGFANLDDLKVGGNLSFTGAGNLIGNNRAIFFTKNGTQTISSAIALTIPYIVFQPASGSTTVQLLSSLTVSAPIAGNAISFSSAADIFDINGNTLTIGTAAVANTIFGSGTFKGSTTSNLTLLGTGSVGTLNFTPTFDNLGTFVMNRQAAITGCVMGTAVTVNTALTLTNGLIDLAATTMTLASTCSNVFGDSANSFVISDVTATGKLRKNVTATGTVYRFPIGDKTGTLEWSPATINFTAGTFASAYVAVAVQDFAAATGKHPNLNATVNFISRYWSVTTTGTFTTPTYTFSSVYVDADINGTEASSISNQWNGSVWSNGGASVSAASNTLSIGGVTTLPATNDFTAAQRDAEIDVFVGVTPYAHFSTYNFGTIATGTNLDVTFTVQNTGQSSLSFLTARTIVGGPTYSDSPQPMVTGALSSGSTRTFIIRFAPSAVGTFTGSISIPNGDSSGGEAPYVINFTGVGATPSPEINIQGAGNNINPGNTPVGFDNTLFAGQNVSTTSAAKSYDIQSLGNIPLLLTGVSPYVTLGGANPGDFTVTVAPLQSIPQSTSSAFSITFTPTAGGTRTATVTVGSNDVSEPTYTFNIEGTGLAPEIEVYGNGISIVNGSSPASSTNNTDFGTVNITTGTVVRTFTVFNTGALSLTLAAATITGADAGSFSITTAPTSPLASNTSTTLVITFDPSTIGVKNALVTIPNNDANENPYTFAILGNGVNYIPCALGPLENIAIQDFEVAPATPTMGYTTSQEVGAGIITVGGGTAYGSSRAVVSNKFIGARSFQISGHLVTSGAIKMTTIDFATVDASAYQEVGLNLKIGAYTTLTTQGLDSNSSDNVKIFISTNNGATWSQEINIAGNSDSIWDINTSSGTATTNFDNNNITTVFSAPAATSVNTGSRNISINNIPNSSQLKIRVIFSLDRLDELWVIDDVKFQGKKPAISTYTSGGWVPSAPTSSTKAIIDWNYSLATPIEACDCEIKATRVVNVSSYLEIQSNFLNSGTLNLSDDASLVQINDAAVNSGSGTFTMTRDVSMRKYDYVYWSSPVPNFPVSSISPTTAADHIWKWIPTVGGDFGNWTNTSENMILGKGYIVRGPSAFTTTPATHTATFTASGASGNYPFNGSVTTPIERGANQSVAGYTNPANGITYTRFDDNLNLVGNPFPSSIKSLDFLNNNTNIEGAVRIWTHGALPAAIVNPFYGSFAYNYSSNDYIVYNGVGTLSGPAGFNGYIAAGQGFFVTMNDGPADNTQTVGFNNAMRSKTYSNSQFYRMSNASIPNVNENATSRIWLDIVGVDGKASRTLIGYTEGATLEKDRMYDATIILDGNQNIYSLINNERMTIQGRPTPFVNSDLIPIGFQSAAVSTYKIAIAATDGLFEGNTQPIYLEDKLLNIIFDLRQAPYVFTSNVGKFDERFVLRYTNAALSNVNYQDDENSVVVFVKANHINIKSYAENIASCKVYDVLGREIYSKENIKQNEFSINEIRNNHQALIVKTTLVNGQIVTRKIVF